MSDAWYVAEPDGNTWGPYAYPDLLRAAVARQFAANSLVWQVELGEWQALSRHFSNAMNATPSTAAPREVTKPVSAPKHAPPSAPKPSTPPPLAGKRPSAKDRVQIDALLRQAEARKAAVAADAAQNAQASSQRLVHVSKRLTARFIDVMSLGLFGASVLWTLMPTNAGPEAATIAEPLLLVWLALAAWFVLEAVVLGVFGTTPGKRLLGLRVLDERGEAPGIPRALRRAFSVYARGLAFGLFILTPIAILVAGGQTLSKGQAPWDDGLTVHDESVASRWQIIGFVIVVLWIAAAEGWWLDVANALTR